MKNAKRHYAMTLRAAKADATKARIRASAMKLYSERPIEDFTLEQVAARAGTTVQTVLRAYGSKDKLVYAALEELAASGVPLKPTPAGDVAAAVQALFDAYDAMGDLVIRRLADEGRRPALKPILMQGRENQRDWVKTVFAPQLAQAGDRAQLLDALLVATDVYVWKLLRRDRKLGRAAAEAIVCRMIDGVVNMEMRHGENPVAQLVGRREPAS